MPWNSYATLLILSALICTILAIHAWQRRGAAGALPLVAVMASAALWSLGYAFEVAAPTVEAKLFWIKVEYPGIALMPPATLILARECTGLRRPLSRRALLLLLVIPLVAVLLTWTNEWHGLMSHNPRLVESGTISIVETDRGLFYWVFVAYAYACLLGAASMLLYAVVSAPRPYNMQALVLLAGLSAPWVANILFVISVASTESMDWTPISFLVTGLLVSWGLFRFELMLTAPIASEMVIRHLGAGVIVVSSDGQILDVNPVAQQILGGEHQKLVGQSLSSVLADKPELLAVLQDPGEEAAPIELPVNGQHRHYDVRVSHLGRGDQPHASVLLLSDTTRLKESEAALLSYQHRLTRQNQELRKLTQALEQAYNAVVITSAQGTIEYVNPSFERTTLFHAEEVLGQFLCDLQTGENEALCQKMWSTVSAGREWEGVFLNRRKDGTLYWDRTVITPVRDETGNVSHLIAIKEDITDQKNAEDALRHYTQELEDQNAELGAFAHTVAHDLKNPVSTLIGYAEVLHQDYAQFPLEMQQEVTTSIIKLGFKINTIIDELLMLASIRGMETIDAHPISMTEVVTEAIGRLHSLIDEYQGEIVLPPKWPVALGYGPWVEEIWVNLISNALKYGGRPPRVTLGSDVMPPAEGEDGAPRTIRFWVRDNGEGISPQAQERLFTPFERLHNTRVKGHGLGLSIVQRIITRLGGEVGVESPAPAMGEASEAAGSARGSLFYFTLPEWTGD